MSFHVPAEAYDSFMGRFSVPLAPGFAGFSAVAAGERVLDVGCGPGALTTVLVGALGPDRVAAVDPSEPLVAAARRRHPGVDVRLASAADLPFATAMFDRALAQLVVHLMPDPIAGIAEMARVTRPGGTVAACVWDHAGGGGPLAAFWEAAHGMDPYVIDESGLPGTGKGGLAALLDSAGLASVEDSELVVSVPFADFEDWWLPFTLGVGPAGQYVSELDEERRELLRVGCAALLPTGSFTLTAKAWAARGMVGPAGGAAVGTTAVRPDA